MIRILIMSGKLMELISRAHLSWKRRVARDLAPHGLNPKQIFVLRKLQESGGLAPSQIADLTFADRPTATSMLGTMERAGYVKRRKDPENAKWVIVEITTKGIKKLESVPQDLWRSGKTTFDPEACLTKDERQELIRLLEKVNLWLQRQD
jgi:DNA-binding MarR family transcriptional regulator